jgi:mannose-6-phosphate isomerase-like protein (cupin superfamily)
MDLQNIFKIPKTRIRAHRGEGLINFARLFGGNLTPLPAESAINFVDIAVLPHGTSIGLHQHKDTTEIYLILEGQGEYLLNGQKTVVHRGDVLVNHCGYHLLRNKGDSELMIYVVEAAIRKSSEGD